MNSMRLLIMLAFILYEIQCAESIKPLNLFKTLFEKHFQPQPATEHEILEPILGEGYHVVASQQTVEGGGTIVELNNKLYMIENRPILTDTENEEVKKEDAETISENVSSNPEEDGEKETYEKDPNTEWLLTETPTEKQPETDQDKNDDTPSIKNIMCNKFKSIVTRIKDKMKPVTEPTVLTSSSNCDNFTKYTTTVSTTAIPVTNPEPTTSVQTTIAMTSSTEKPSKICMPEDHGNVNIKCQPPIVNNPYYPYYYPPYQPWSNNCQSPANQQSFDCQPNVRYILFPVYMYTYSTKPQPFNNIPYAGSIPNYQRVMDYGVLKETQNYQPSSPVNADQLFNYNNYDSRPTSYAVHHSYPVSSFIPQTPIQAADEVPSNNLVFPNLRYPTHTMAPIVVKPYPADNVASNALPVEHRDPINVEVDSFNRFSGPMPMPNNGQDYPYRGDIRITDSGPTNVYERQLEENPSKERRQIVHDHEKMPLIDPSTKFETLDTKSNISNVNGMEV